MASILLRIGHTERERETERLNESRNTKEVGGVYQSPTQLDISNPVQNVESSIAFVC